MRFFTGFPVGAVRCKVLKNYGNCESISPICGQGCWIWNTELGEPSGLDYSVDQLEIRFQFEEERLAAGLPINTREFHRELKKRIQEVEQE